MSDLGGFNKRGDRQPRETPVARPAPRQAPAERPARKPYDRDRCPPGWDEGVWHLALLFEQYARAYGIELRAGRPIIYGEIDGLVRRFEMRGRDTIGTYPHEVHGCERRKLDAKWAARCWYHYPPNAPDQQVARELTWVEMFEVVLAEFWSRIQNEYATDHLSQFFAEYARAAIAHWRSLRMIKEIDDRPKQPREIMRRKRPGATMSATSKEG